MTYEPELSLIAAGLLALTAFSAGAYHVTAVDRWLYLSLICKETLVKNGADDARYNVLYKRPTDLNLKSDVKICCNLLVCEMFDEGRFLTYKSRKHSP